MGYAQLVIGPTASGKSVYCSSILRHCEAMGRTIHIVNLDPAAQNLPYPTAMDIRDLISSDDVMAQLGFGPNTGLIYCMQHLEDNFHSWLNHELEDFREDDYLVFDLPGQIELFTHLPFVQNLENMSFSVCAVYLLDSQFMDDASKFIGGCMSCPWSVSHLGIPCVMVMSKIERVEKGKDLEFYLNPNPRLLMLDRDSRMQPRFRKLNEALIEFVQGYDLVSFIPLDLGKESSIRNVLSMIDNAINYEEESYD